MESALLEAVRSVPGLAFAAFVFWLISGLWGRALAEQREERDAHKEVVEAVVAAFKAATSEIGAAADRRAQECSDRCVAAVRKLKGGEV